MNSVREEEENIHWNSHCRHTIRVVCHRVRKGTSRVRDWQERTDRIDRWRNWLVPLRKEIRKTWTSRWCRVTYVTGWLLARVVTSIWECLRASRSLCLPLSPAESGPTRRASRNGTDSRSRYKRPRIISKKTALNFGTILPNLETLSVCSRVFLRREKGTFVVT